MFFVDYQLFTLPQAHFLSATDDKRGLSNQARISLINTTLSLTITTERYSIGVAWGAPVKTVTNEQITAIREQAGSKLGNTLYSKAIIPQIIKDEIANKWFMVNKPAVIYMFSNHALVFDRVDVKIVMRQTEGLENAVI
jgi:hypothetical protein